MMYHIALILVLIGALNWGLVGVSELMGTARFDLVEYIGVTLLGLPIVAQVIYVVVGIAAIIVAIMAKDQ